MGLDPSTQAQPKIAILSPSNDVDIIVHAISMGAVHKAVPMTVGLCLGVAANVKDTLPWTVARMSGLGRRERAGLVRIQHPGGIVDVGAEFEENGDVKSAKVVRTGRRLMKGVVWW
jgi:2-methylaconitate cis-trans-isomerase PrpF